MTQFDVSLQKSTALLEPPVIHLGRHQDIRLVAFDNFADASPYWLMLQRRSLGSPFQKHAWLDSCLEASELSCSANQPNSLSRPLYVFGFREAQPVILFPLVIQRGISGTQLRWLADYICDYNGALIDREFSGSLPSGLFSEVLNRLSNAFPAIDLIQLIRNPQNHPNLPELEIPAEQRLGGEHNSHALALQKNWHAFYKALRSSNTRRRLRNKIVALRKCGRLSFRRIRRQNEKLACSSLIMDWKSDQLEKNGDRNPFGTSDASNPIRRTVAHAINSKEKSLEIFCLILDGKPIAGIISLLTGETFHLWITAYDPSVDSRFSAGTVLLVRTLELAARAGFKHFDFLLGDESYKQDWCDIRIPLANYLKPLTFKGHALYALATARLAVKKEILRRPYAMNAIRRLRRAITRFGRTGRTAADQADVSPALLWAVRDESGLESARQNSSGTPNR